MAKFEINCNPGNYSITTTYNNTSIINYITIKNTVVSSNINIPYNANYNYKLRIIDSAGNPVKNTEITVSVNNGKSKNYTTDNSGYITLKFTKLTKAQKITAKNPMPST